MFRLSAGSGLWWVVALYSMSCENGDLFAGEFTTRSFVNISLPVPVRNPGTPRALIVIKASPQEIVFARLALLGIMSRRDAQVLVGSEGNWRFLGSNGDGLTNGDGTFLCSAMQGPDGQIWLLLTHSRHPIFGPMATERHLYYLEGDLWRRRSANETTDNYMTGPQLRFLGSATPVIALNPYAWSNRWKNTMYGLENGTWALFDVSEAIRNDRNVGQAATRSDALVETAADLKGAWAWRPTDGWYFMVHRDRTGNNAHVTAYHVANWKSLAKHVTPIAVTMQQEVVGAAVSADNRFAVVLEDRNTETCEICVTRAVESDNTGEATVQRFPVSSGPPRICEWSPQGDLYICCVRGPYELEVFKLAPAGRTRVAHHRQDAKRGQIKAVQMTFRTDGLPIVVWSDVIQLHM